MLSNPGASITALPPKALSEDAFGLGCSPHVTEDIGSLTLPLDKTQTATMLTYYNAKMLAVV